MKKLRELRDALNQLTEEQLDQNIFIGMSEDLFFRFDSTPLRKDEDHEGFYQVVIDGLFVAEEDYVGYEAGEMSPASTFDDLDEGLACGDLQVYKNKGHVEIILDIVHVRPGESN